VLQVYTVLASADNSSVFRTFASLENRRVLHQSSEQVMVYVEQVLMGGPKFMRRKYRMAVVTTIFPDSMTGEFHLARPGAMQTYQVQPLSLMRVAI
jgi:hypothetical protein